MKLYWILLYIWTASALPVFLILLKQPAPLGRFTSAQWGKTIPDRLAWFIMELPALLTQPIVYLIGTGGRLGNPVAALLVGVWIGHYLHRTAIYPFRIRTRGKMMPLSIVSMGFTCNLIHGFFSGYYYSQLADYAVIDLASLRFIVGVFLFLFGLALNFRADSILIALRSSNAGGYQIPRAGPFRWVSCPNYLGEIVEWIGYAIMAWSLPGAALLCGLSPICCHAPFSTIAGIGNISQTIRPNVK